MTKFKSLYLALHFGQFTLGLHVPGGFMFDRYQYSRFWGASFNTHHAVLTRGVNTEWRVRVR